MNQLLDTACDFIHEAQKERGSASFYLRSKGEAFGEELEEQFSAVDASVKPLLSLVKKDNLRVEPLLQGAQHLPNKRKYILARMLEPIDAMNFYTRELIAPAIEMVQQIAVFDPTNHAGKVAALVHFLQWKERIGLERALGTQLLERTVPESPEFRNKLEYLITEQQAYERMFLALTDEKGKRAIEQLKKGKVFQQIEAINQNVLKRVEIPSTRKITAEEWFALFTAKMDLLHEVGKVMTANLQTPAESKPIAGKTNKAKLEAAGIESSVRAYMDIIHALPLFVGLNEETLQDILKYSRVVSHNKGALIFMQREQATRFYIVLEGWVKLFKGNPEGEESILQVMGVGETLLETVIFNNTPYPVNAQAVEQVKLLSIPAAIIRERLQHNKELAMNMLTTVAGRSQALISQFEQLTLKTVTQRVGWFLLKLFLESGERSSDLKLPYDKSLIASYLGMKPETFSRTLQTLRERGILVDGNMVNLPDVFALCTYCDMELAERCSRAGTEECPDPNCG